LNAIAAPSTPSSGVGAAYIDSTSKNLAIKNDAGTVNHGVQTKAFVANSFLTAISDAGVVSSAQPSAANLSNGTTGGGAVVLATSPTLVTPNVGSATADTINLPTNAHVNGPSIGNGGNTLLLVAGTSGLQFNNQNNTVALMTLSNTGTLNVVQGYQINGVAGVDCPSGTVDAGTITVAKGLVTHC
jgi:hypothetical protein